jgi:hypothetical protein
MLLSRVILYPGSERQDDSMTESPGFSKTARYLLFTISRILCHGERIREKGFTLKLCRGITTQPLRPDDD